KVRQRGNPKIEWTPDVKGEGDKISIEHIMPKEPNKDCWQEVIGEFDPDEVKFLQGNLGNLVQLSHSINSSLQNDCFADKKTEKYSTDGKQLRQGYNDGSHSEIEVSGYEVWDAQAILKRGMDMLRFMESRWDLQFENEDEMKRLLCLE